MKRKQLAKRIAIAMLSAATVMTAAPVGVFAAQTTSVEADNAVKTNDTDKVSVTGTANSQPETVKAIKTILADNTELVASGKSADDLASAIASKLSATAIKAADPNTAITTDGGVTNVKVDGKDVPTTKTTGSETKLSFTISFDDGEVYDVVVDLTVDANELGAGDVKNQLEIYFGSKTFSTEKGVTPTSAGVAAQLTADQTKGGEFATGKTYEALQPATTVKFRANGGQLTKNTDGTYSGKIDVSTNSGTSWSHYSFKNATFTEVDSTALSTAIATVSQNTYPNPTTTANHTANELNAKLAADINEAAGANVIDSITATGTTSKAERRNNYNGRYTVTIGSQQLSVALKYGSEEKSKNTTDSIETALKPAGSPSDVYLKDAKAQTYGVTGTTDDKAKLYTFTKTSQFSKSVQALTATTAATSEDARVSVEKLITDQLTKDGYADNGVTVKATVLEDGYATSAGTSLTTPESGSDNKPATSTATAVSPATGDGYYNILVTTSIANDYKGWGQDKASTEDHSYVVKVELNKLKSEETKDVAIADKNISLAGDYTNHAATPVVRTLVTLDPTLTPADSNDKVDYIVKDSKGNVIINTADASKEVATSTTGEKLSNTYTDKDKKAYTAKTNQLAFFAKAADKFTVTAKVGDSESTATITVTDSFSDAMSKSSYYYDAVKWAKTNEISSGIGNNQFGVNKTVTRAEFVTWLYRYAQKANNIVGAKGDTSTLKFTDVSKDAYYAEAVAWASANGVVYGTTDTTFAPNAPVTRAQALTFVWRLAGKPDSGAIGEKDEATTQFTDVHSNDYFVNAVTWAVNSRRSYDNGVDRADVSDKSANIASGTSTTTFSPNDDCTRSAGISFIYRAFGGNL